MTPFDPHPGEMRSDATLRSAPSPNGWTRLEIILAIAKNAMLSVPAIRRWRERERIRLGYDEAKDSYSYTRAVFDTHLQDIDIRGLDILEIGPGGNLGVGLLSLLAGARTATAIDVLPWVQGEQQTLLEEIASLDGRTESAGRAAEIRHYSDVSIEECSLPDDSFDVIISHACLEHVHRPSNAIAEIYRLLRPGGITSHQIDLRDHRDFSRPVAFLYHRRLTWWLLDSNRGVFRTNRWRYSDFIQRFKLVGFENVEWAATHSITLSEADQRRMAEPFRNLDSDALSITGIRLTARKPIEQRRDSSLDGTSP